MERVNEGAWRAVTQRQAHIARRQLRQGEQLPGDRVARFVLDRREGRPFTFQLAAKRSRVNGQVRRHLSHGVDSCEHQ